MRTRVLELAGRLPPGLRATIMRSPIGPLIHHTVGSVVGEGTEIVPLSGLLEGYRMRLDLQHQRGMAYGDYELAVAQAIARLVQPGWTVADIGAQIGYMTLLLARRVGPTGQVWAFEPLPRNFAVLQENVALNHLDQVKLTPCAVSNRPGKVQLHQLDDRALSATSSLLRPVNATARGGVEVEAVTFDGWAPPGQRVDFIKLDVESAEGLVMEGMRETLTRYRPLVLLEVHSTGDRESQALVRLQAAGYTLNALESDQSTPPVGPDYIGHVLAVPSFPTSPSSSTSSA